MNFEGFFVLVFGHTETEKLRAKAKVVRHHEAALRHEEVLLNHYEL